MLACGTRSNRSLTWGATLGLGRIGLVPLLHGCLILLSVGIMFISNLALAQSQKSIAEEIEWTWEVRPQHADSRLPNVLLLGDSITRNYFPWSDQQSRRRRERLSHGFIRKRWKSASSPPDRRIRNHAAGLLRRCTLQQRIAWVGLYGIALRDRVPGFSSHSVHAAWPCKTDLGHDHTRQTGGNHRCNHSTDRCKHRYGRSCVDRKAIPVDDQHGLMMRHLDLYEDSIHFNKTGADIMANPAAASIEQALQSSSH